MTPTKRYAIKCSTEEQARECNAKKLYTVQEIYVYGKPCIVGEGALIYQGYTIISYSEAKELGLLGEVSKKETTDGLDDEFESKLYSVEEINKFIFDSIIYQKEGFDANKISDYYHTFGDLYKHRVALYIRLVNETLGKYKRHKSKKQGDGKTIGGWFIVMGYIPDQISYHLPLDMRDNIKCEEKEIADEWDQHSSDQVVSRLLLSK